MADRFGTLPVVDPIARAQQQADLAAMGHQAPTPPPMLVQALNDPQFWLRDIPRASIYAGANMLPGSGIADALGQLPSHEGGKYPSLGANVMSGNYAAAGNQTLGALADLAMAVPGAFGVSMAAKSLLRDPYTFGEIPFNRAIPNTLGIEYQHGMSWRNQRIQKRFGQQLSRNIGRALRDYAAIPETQGGRVVSVDEARRLSPDYAKDWSLSEPVHEPGSALMKWHYEQLLAQDAKNSGKENLVMFTGGGTGAGKTSGLRQVLAPVADKAQIIYDTNMAKFPSAKKKIDQALAAGKSVRLTYVYRDPVDALVNGAFPRAMKNGGKGRTVPLIEHLNTHIGGNETIRALSEHYANEPRVTIDLIDNSHGRNNAILSTTGLNILPKLDRETLYAQLQHELEKARAEGRITRRVYKAFKSK